MEQGREAAAPPKTLDVSASDYETMLAESNVSHAKKVLGILSARVGMEMILTESLLPIRCTLVAGVIVTDIELRKDEWSFTRRVRYSSIAACCSALCFSVSMSS